MISIPGTLPIDPGPAGYLLAFTEPQENKPVRYRILYGIKISVKYEYRADSEADYDAGK